MTKRRFVLFGLFVLLALAIWRIACQPIQVNFLTPYFEEMLSRNEEGWQLNVEETVLAWRGWSRPIDLRLRNLVVRDKDGEQIIKLPEASVGLSLTALWHGKVGVRRLEILGAELLLERDETGHVAMGDKAADASERATTLSFDLIDRLLAPPNAEYPISFLELLRVEAERIVWSDKGRKVQVTAAPLTFDARRTEDGLRCDVTMQLDPETGSGRPGPRLQLAAMARNEHQQSLDAVKAASLTISLVARANGLPVTNLGRYWPPKLADSARTWVVENIRSGAVDEAILNMTLERENGETSLTRLDGTLRYAGLAVHYLDDWPETESLHGQGSFTRQGLRFDVAGGRVGAIEMGPSTVEIDGLDSDDERIRIETQLTGPSNAIADVVVRPRPDLVEFLPLDQVGAIEQGVADLEIAFPLQGGLSVADVRIVGHGNLPRLSPRNSYVEGNVDASVDFRTTTDGKSSVDLNLDLSRSVVAIPFLGWRKEAGVEGTATLSVDLDHFRARAIRDLEIAAGTLQARGSLRLDDEGRKVESVELADVSVDNTHLSRIAVTDSVDGLRVELGEGSLDVEAIRRGANGSTEKQEEGDRGRKLVVDAPKLQQVRFGADRALEDVSVHAERDGRGLWQNVAVTGKTPGENPGRFEVGLKPAAGGRQDLAIRVDDTGSLVRVLGMTMGLRGGRLNATGRMAAGNLTPLEVQIEMRDYAFLRASILTRLLTLASGRGFGKITTDDEIAFDYLGGNVVFSDGRFTTDRLRAHGPALGLTAEGWVDLDQDQMKLEGAIVPVYAANRVLGKIPVLGSLLSGDGKEGFLAVRYRVNGDLKNPKMEVDTLKSLTPAFLREVFGQLEAAVER